MLEGNTPPHKNDLAIAEKKIKILREISKTAKNLQAREKKIINDLNQILPRVGEGMAALSSSNKNEELSLALEILERDFKNVQSIVRRKSK